MDALARHRVLALAGVVTPRIEYRDETVEELGDVEEFDELDVDEEDLEDEDDELDDEDDEVEPTRSAADWDREYFSSAHELRLRQSDNTSTVGGKSQDQSVHPHVASGPKGGQFAPKGGGGSKAAPKAKAAAAPSSVPQAPATPRTMKPGDSGEDVRYAQYAMSLLGFHVNQNGAYDAQTAGAVKEIQSRLGMAKPNGHLSAAQLHKLQDAVRLSPCVGQSRSFGQDLGETRSLDDIEARHRSLVLLGVPVVPPPPDDDDTIDDATRSILDALDEWVERQLDEDWDERARDVSKELRIPGGKGGGRWTASPISTAIAHALEDWGKGKGPDDPFVFDGKPIDREPLRKAAVARGITLKRGASRDDIVKALLGGVKDEVVAARTERQKRRSGAKFSIDVGGKPPVWLDFKSGLNMQTADSALELKFRHEIEGADGHRVPPAEVADHVDAWLAGPEGPAAKAARLAAGSHVPGSYWRPGEPEWRRSEEIQILHEQDARWREIASRLRKAPPTVGGKRIDVAVYTGTDPNAPTLREITSANRPGRVITSQPDLAGLEKWATDNGHTDVADWAKSERARVEAKNAPKAAKKAAPRKRTTPEAAPSTDVTKSTHAAPLSGDELQAIVEIHGRAGHSEGGWVRKSDMSPASARHLDGLVEQGWLQKHSGPDGDLYRVDPRSAGTRKGQAESTALVGDVLPAQTAPDSQLKLTKLNRGAIIEGHIGEGGTFGNEPTPGSRPVRVVVQRIEPLDQNGQPVKAPILGGVGELGHFQMSGEKPMARIIGHDADTGRRVESDVVSTNSRWSWHMNPDTATSPDIEGEVVPTRPGLAGAPAKKAATKAAKAAPKAPGAEAEAEAKFRTAMRKLSAPFGSDTKQQWDDARLHALGLNGRTPEQAVQQLEADIASNEALLREQDALGIEPHLRRRTVQALPDDIERQREMARLIRKTFGLPPAGRTRKDAAAPKAPSEPKLTAADRAQAAKVASAFHEDWRKTRLQSDGSFEPRVKTTTDKAWIAKHGTDQVDIANSSYADLPEDWKAENKAAAEVVQGILKAHGGTVDLNDEKTRLAVGEQIHQAWLSRNDWAKGGELDVPFADLPRSEQDKDTDQLKVAMGVLAPKVAAPTVPRAKGTRNKVDKKGFYVGMQDRTTSAGPGRLVSLTEVPVDVGPGDRLYPSPERWGSGYNIDLQKADGSTVRIEQSLTSHEQATERIAELNDHLGRGPGAPKAPSEPKAAAKRVPKAAKAAPSTTEQHVAAIQNLKTSEEVAAYLDSHPMTVGDMRKLAKGLGGTVSSRGTTKAGIRQDIIAGTAGFRERGVALAGPGGMSILQGTPSAPHPDGLDSLEGPRLKSYAAEFLDSTSGMNDAQLRAALRAQGVGSPEVEQAKRIAEAAPKVETPKVPEVPTSRADLSTDPAVRKVQIENRVRAAYTAVLDRRGRRGLNWVNFAELRQEIGSDISRDELDHALTEMIRWDGQGTRPVHIVRESNQKLLTQAHRDAALQLGNEPMHLIRIEDPTPRPLPAGGARPKGDRAAKVTAARNTSDVVAEVHELVGNDATPAAIRHRLSVESQRTGVDTTHLQALADDPKALQAAADKMADDAGLRRVGDVGAKPVPFERKAHTLVGPDVESGSSVKVVRPTHVATLSNGEQVSMGPAKVRPVTGPSTPGDFEARLASARSGTRAESLAPVRITVDASAGADTSRWKATEATGFTGSSGGLLSAITRRVRESGPFNERLRFPEGKPLQDHEVKTREFVGPARFDAERARKAAMADRDIKVLDRAMAQSKLPEDAVVWRGGRNAARLGIPETGSAVGTEWTDAAYVGTSAQRGVAEGFIGGRGGYLARILAPQGTSAIRISGGGESELMFDRGLRYRVVADHGTTAGGVRIVDVEIVPAEAPTAIRSSAPGEPHRYRHGWIPIDPLEDLSDDELLDHFHQLSQADVPDEAALHALDAELARREDQPFDSPESRRVDELVAKGHGYLDAYAEVHGLDVSKLEREQRMQRVNQERRPGESRAQTVRRMHAEHVALAVLQAEDDTRGNLLNREGRAAGIDPATLWSGPAARARKYASDELKQWWSEHGGRMTAAEWAAQFTGDTKAAEAARLAGQGKDFGV